MEHAARTSSMDSSGRRPEKAQADRARGSDSLLRFGPAASSAAAIAATSSVEGAASPSNASFTA
ncbi:MAG: hypothetical protein M3R35_00080 [Candidatus Eremiobacteraeota bacterium]|nr:hypothetical protein [Candidatus Eremiobacteraeota bacterium]